MKANVQKAGIVFYESGSSKKNMPSSVIAAMHYQKTTSTFRITLISGMVYKYQNVPEEIYIAMKESHLKGTF